MGTEPQKTGVIYVRVSSADQVQGTSLEMQERLCREYAQREGIEVLQVYIEQGESAKTVNRTQFQKALAFCATKKVGYFIVHKLDRFARNADDHVTTQVLLRRYGTKLRSVSEHIDETPVGKLMEGVISSVAEFDNNVRAERSKSGMMERVQRGEWVWAAPLGYKRIIQGGNLVPDEARVWQIMHIFDEYAKGTHSFKSLAKHMAQLGMTTRQGKKLCPQVIEYILRNPLYYGQIEAMGMKVKGNFEPLIEEDLFWRCQPGVQKKSKSVPHRIENDDFPLRRLVICPECGTSLTGSHSKGRSKTYAYYHHHRQDCPAAVSIPKETLEQNFAEYLDGMSPTVQNEKIFRAVVADVWQSNFKKLDADNSRIRKEVEELEVERQKVFDLHRSGKYNDDEFLEQKEIVTRSIHQKKALLEEKRIEEFNMDEALEYCFNFVRQSGETWKRLSTSPRLRSRFQKAVFPDKVSFIGNKGFETAEMSLVYKLNQHTGADSTNLVRLPGFEPGTISLRGSCSTN